MPNIQFADVEARPYIQRKIRRFAFGVAGTRRD